MPSEANPIDHKITKSMFVGIDSDGCVFDTMEVKHKECFIPAIIEYYGLAAVSKYAREAGEFVNLYSKWRGINRFPALLMTMDLLEARPEVKRRGSLIPKLPTLRRWVAAEKQLGNPALERTVKETNDPELAHCLAWSKAVNATIERVVHHVPPFPMVRECLERLADRVDALVVSATPGEALKREWLEHGLAHFVQQICGQEVGTKSQILAVARRYPEHQSLMIGDAPGDLEAAKNNGALFFPINPGEEEASWRELAHQGLDRFFEGRFAGDYQLALLEQFERRLPSTPPWRH